MRPALNFSIPNYWLLAQIVSVIGTRLLVALQLFMVSLKQVEMKWQVKTALLTDDGLIQVCTSAGALVNVVLRCQTCSRNGNVDKKTMFTCFWKFLSSDNCKSKSNDSMNSAIDDVTNWRKIWRVSKQFLYSVLLKGTMADWAIHSINARPKAHQDSR